MVCHSGLLPANCRTDSLPSTYTCFTSTRTFFVCFARTEFVNFYLHYLCKGKNRVEILIFLSTELERFQAVIFTWRACVCLPSHTLLPVGTIGLPFGLDDAGSDGPDFSANGQRRGPQLLTVCTCALSPS